MTAIARHPGAPIRPGVDAHIYVVTARVGTVERATNTGASGAKAGGKCAVADVRLGLPPPLDGHRRAHRRRAGQEPRQVAGAPGTAARVIAEVLPWHEAQGARGRGARHQQHSAQDQGWQVSCLQGGEARARARRGVAWKGRLAADTAARGHRAFHHLVGRLLPTSTGRQGQVRRAETAQGMPGGGIRRVDWSGLQKNCILPAKPLPRCPPPREALSPREPLVRTGQVRRCSGRADSGA